MAVPPHAPPNFLGKEIVLKGGGTPYYKNEDDDDDNGVLKGDR